MGKASPNGVLSEDVESFVKLDDDEAGIVSSTVVAAAPTGEGGPEISEKGE